VTLPKLTNALVVEARHNTPTTPYATGPARSTQETSRPSARTSTRSSVRRARSAGRTELRPPRPRSRV
jgi:hypothetical protein